MHQVVLRAQLIIDHRNMYSAINNSFYLERAVTLDGLELFF